MVAPRLHHYKLSLSCCLCLGTWRKHHVVCGTWIFAGARERTIFQFSISIPLRTSGTSRRRRRRRTSSFTLTLDRAISPPLYRAVTWRALAELRSCLLLLPFFVGFWCFGRAVGVLLRFRRLFLAISRARLRTPARGLWKPLRQYRPMSRDSSIAVDARA